MALARRGAGLATGLLRALATQQPLCGQHRAASNHAENTNRFIIEALQ